MTTPLDALATALTGTAAYQKAAEAAPEAVVWCDAPSDFTPILPALRTRLPQVVTLGEYDPAARTGPALWLRAAAARQVPGVAWPESEPPILYLPGIAREVLRGAEDCPQELAPLVWFAVSGAFFGQPKQGRDWTMRGFLAAQGGPVGLNIPEDKTTRDALARAATRLFAEPLAALTGKQWDASALDGLLVEDSVVSMLAWIDGTLTKEADPARFEAFSALAVKQFGLDPRKKQRQDAAARLARREKAWGKVWERFEQTGGGYEGVVKLLGFEEPPQADLLDIPVAYPKANAQRENSLRTALLALRDQPAEKAAQTVRELETAHAWRRGTVWAKRGEARLAQALEHLAVVAGAVPLPTHDAEAMAAAYGQAGWHIDAAAVTTLDLARNGDDRAAVVATLRAIYLPWLDAGASALQALVGAGKVKLATPTQAPAPPNGAVLLFVDGLRMDLGQKLADLLRSRGASVAVGQRWSGFPTVTATCKSLASPAAHLLVAGSPEAMLPAYEGKAAQKPTLVKAIEAAGWSCVTSLLPDKPVWQEAGQFDQEGHALGAKLAERVQDGLEGVAAEVVKLAQQGRRVRVVTDHGWLLMPEGLPPASLTSALVQPSGRGNRVALLKEGAPTTFLRVPWSWNSAVQYATPPGARVFYAGTEYAHGGISPQECVLPVLDVTAEGMSKPLTILAQWRNLMVRVKVDGGSGLMADVRLGSDTSGRSVLVKSPKALDDAGQVNLGVDGDYEGHEVCIVVWRPESPQNVAAKLVTKVGG